MIDRREDTTLNWMPMTVDEQGPAGDGGDLGPGAAGVQAVAASSRERLGGAAGISMVSALAAFEAPPG
jgi:hypothetical protein